MHLFLTRGHVSSTTAPGPPLHPVQEKAGLSGGGTFPPVLNQLLPEEKTNFFFNLKELYVYA